MTTITTHYDASYQRVCGGCKRLFVNAAVFAKHRPLGKCLSEAELRDAQLWDVPCRPLRTGLGVIERLWVDGNVRAPSQPSNDAADFDPSKAHPRVELKRCNACKRVFGNRWVFLRHRPEGRGAISEPVDPTVPCYSDRQLSERLGMWQTHGVWWDDGKVSPLDEVPGAERQGHGKGRTFTEGNRYGAHAQARRQGDGG